jgi:Family of unknown function (DUF5889)
MQQHKNNTIDKYLKLYLNEKSQFINMNEIVRYLYETPIHNSFNEADLNPTNNKNKRRIIITDKSLTNMCMKILLLMEIPLRVKNLATKSKNITKIPSSFKLTKIQIKIGQVLDRNFNEYQVGYFMNWNFNSIIGERKSLIHKENVHIINLEFDVFGVIVTPKMKLHLFGIICDGDKNTKAVTALEHRNKLINQYISYNTGIHHLRIKLDTNDIECEIKKFLSKIIKNKEYVSINPIIPSSIAVNDYLTNKLNEFHCIYENNHIICLKYHKPPKVIKNFITIMDAYDTEKKDELNEITENMIHKEPDENIHINKCSFSKLKLVDYFV